MCYTNIMEAGKKIKIGFFNDSFYPMMDGVIRVMEHIANHLRDRCDIIFFVPEYKEAFVRRQIPV